MARKRRYKQIDPFNVGIYHGTSRCVRRAFLWGHDKKTGQDFEHRWQWIQDRLEFLASCFQIDVLGSGLLGNYFHCILRNRPDWIRACSDLEIVRFWWRLSAASQRSDGSTKPITRGRLKRMLDPRLVEEDCRRLSSLS